MKNRMPKIKETCEENVNEVGFINAFSQAGDFMNGQLMYLNSNRTTYRLGLLLSLLFLEPDQIYQ